MIGIGDVRWTCPSHTTRHAGPHRAVRKVEVMRAKGYQSCQSIPLSASRLS